MQRKTKVVIAGVGILLLFALLTTTSSATTQFVSPTQLHNGSFAGDRVNLEGRVRNLSSANDRITFVVTDGNASVPVVYEKTMPETMSDGRIVVAKGVFEDGQLHARQLSVRAHEGSDNGNETTES